jgi:N,N'-diacetyllegionaminate synthase
MAATLGACMIEKHVTLDRNMSGPDHKASVTFSELKQLCYQLSLVPLILGKSEKSPNKSELKMLPKVRKSIVSLKEIQKGERFTLNNITIKRPATGIAPKYFEKLLSKTAKKKINADRPLMTNDYE